MAWDDQSLQDAESAVVGACLLSRLAIQDCVGTVAPGDFHDVRKGQLYGLILELHGRGEAVDAILVGNEAARRRVTDRGGPLWQDRGEVHALLMAVPTTAHAGYYAEVVAKAAHARRIAQALRTGLVDAETTDDPAQALAGVLGALTGLRDGIKTDGLAARSLTDVLADEDHFDWLIPGLLEKADRLLLTGAEGGGKALALDTPIPTPKGWTTMGALSTGDEVFGADGRPTRVTHATHVQHNRTCYRVTFSDGAQIVADADHLWSTVSLGAREARAKLARGGACDVPAEAAVQTTEDIRDTLYRADGTALNHAISTAAPLAYPRTEQPIPPYALGAWLGDGTSANAGLTCDDPELVEHIRAAGEPVRHYEGIRYAMTNGRGGVRTTTFANRLRLLGLVNNKHVPDIYLHGDVDQRLELLRGLMDTDGTIASGDGDGRGHGAASCEFSVVNERLARDVHELLLGLGIKAAWAEGDAKINGRVVGTRYRLKFQTHLDVFRLERKRVKQRELRTARYRYRYITSVEPVGSVPVRCIQVDSRDRLYLAGRECIPTHNTTFMRQVAICAAAGVHPLAHHQIDPVDVVVVDAENSERQWRRQARGIAHAAMSAGSRPPGHGLHLACAMSLDITTDRDLSAIHALLDEHNPGMLVIGSLYRLTPGDQSKDEVASAVLAALDSLRSRGVALLVEAHAGHGKDSKGTRALRPYGSSIFMRWPEFGMGIQPDAEDPRYAHLVRWRGDREARDWPDVLAMGGRFPWETTGPLRSQQRGGWA